MSTNETQLEFDFMQPEQMVFEFASSSSQPLLTLTPNYTVTFHNDKGIVGKLDWNNGPMTFEGDADESAQLFFEHIIQRYFQTSLFAVNPTGSGWKS